MDNHEKINYVEFPAEDFEATKSFFNKVFGWEFVDYGPEYTSFSNAGIDGGFFKSDKNSSTLSPSSDLARQHRVALRKRKKEKAK